VVVGSDIRRIVKTTKNLGYMKKITKTELFDLLYTLEDKFEYDETKMGLRIGLLINDLQKELS
jgi:hypothetical protein